MKTLQEKKIKKLEEIIKELTLSLKLIHDEIGMKKIISISCDNHLRKIGDKVDKLVSELAALDKEIEQWEQRMSAEEILDLRYEYYRNMLNKPQIPLEARQLIFEAMEQYASQSNGYPESFIFWLSGGNHSFVYWSDENGEYFTDEVSDRRWSIFELYNYWITDIKDK